MAELATIATIAGTAISTLGAIQSGRQQAAKLEYEAKVAEQQGDEAMAASQRDASARYREGRLIQSQQRAAVAAAGGSVADQGVIDLMGDTQQQVAVAGDTELYKGIQQKKGYTDQANVARADAKAAMQSAYINAGANLFSGISGMYSRFGAPQTKTVAASGSTAPLYG